MLFADFDSRMAYLEITGSDIVSDPTVPVFIPGIGGVGNLGTASGTSGTTPCVSPSSPSGC